MKLWMQVISFKIYPFIELLINLAAKVSAYNLFENDYKHIAAELFSFQIINGCNNR